MNVRSLSREELTELKCNYYTEQLDASGECPSMGELANIDEIVSDETVFKEYESTEFVEEDFSCNMTDEKG